MSVDPNQIPDPEDSPNEKLLLETFSVPTRNIIREMLSEHPTREEIAELLEKYDDDLGYQFERLRRYLQQWANAHTHPASGGGSGDFGGRTFLDAVTVDSSVADANDLVSFSLDDGSTGSEVLTALGFAILPIEADALGRVLVCTRSTGGRVRMYNSDGTTAWDDTDDGFDSRVAFVTDDGHAAVVDSSGVVRTYEPDGTRNLSGTDYGDDDVIAVRPDGSMFFVSTAVGEHEGRDFVDGSLIQTYTQSSDTWTNMRAYATSDKLVVSNARSAIACFDIATGSQEWINTDWFGTGFESGALYVDADNGWVFVVVENGPDSQLALVVLELSTGTFTGDYINLSTGSVTASESYRSKFESYGSFGILKLSSGDFFRINMDPFEETWTVNKDQNTQFAVLTE